MILIDIEMPQCCQKCPMYNDFYDYPTCNVTGHSMGYKFNPYEKRMPSCPLRYRKNEKNIQKT